LKWLQVSITLDGELAEPVSELLHRYCKGGVILEASQKDGLLELRGYLSITPDSQSTRRKIEEGLWYLGRIQPLPEPIFEVVQEQNWAEAWKQHYRPVLIGQRLLVLPAWLENPHPDRIPILLDPGMAFGTGTHPTTKLSLEALEKHVRPGSRVLDLGTGSGILAIAAAKLGADAVLGLDIDPVAVESAKANLLRNDVGDVVSVDVGSIRDCPARASFDLIVANILTPILLQLLEQGLDDLVPSGGKLILSGILDHQAEDVKRAYQSHELKVIQELACQDWRALIFNRK
jgi:ribosomal protein L11 methyltransferase